MSEEPKECRLCKVLKTEEDYYRRNDTGKLRGLCKECIAKRQKIYRNLNREYLTEKKLEWQRDNKEKRREINRRYLIKNREKINEYNKYYKREKQSLNARIVSNYRGRIWKAIKRGDKAKRTKELLGCSIEYFKKHIEKRFTKNMSWDNYGDWHIDHIKPCSKYNLKKEKEQLQCFNFKNLQPLWAGENLIKSNKWNK